MSAQLDVLLAQAANDPDSIETQEWLDALESVLDQEGPERAHYLLERMWIWRAVVVLTFLSLVTLLTSIRFQPI
jgi:pyruvate dehydrogenase complex dehydrogenase (E1) component